MREHDLEMSDRYFQPGLDDSVSLKWLKATVQYVRMQMGGRVLVNTWLVGNRKLQVQNVHALRDGSIVLHGALEDGKELRVSLSLENVMLEMEPAPVGKMSTGFAFIGISRTPQPFLDGTTAPTAPHGGEAGHHGPNRHGHPESGPVPHGEEGHHH